MRMHTRDTGRQCNKPEVIPQIQSTHTFTRARTRTSKYARPHTHTHTHSKTVDVMTVYWRLCFIDFVKGCSQTLGNVSLGPYVVPAQMKQTV